MVRIGGPQYIMMILELKNIFYIISPKTKMTKKYRNATILKAVCGFNRLVCDISSNNL